MSAEIVSLEEIETAKLKLSGGVETANRVFSSLAIPLIESDRYTILTPQQYRQLVETEDRNDSHPESPRLRNNEPRMAADSGAIVLPNRNDVLIRTDHIDTLVTKDPSGAMLAGTIGHEWIHRLGVDHRKEIFGEDLSIILGGKGNVAAIRERFLNLGPLQFLASGMAIELRNRGKLVRYYNLYLFEFSADLARYRIITSVDSSPYSVESLVRSIIHSEINTIDTVLPGEDLQLKLTRLFAVLFTHHQSRTELGLKLKQSYEDQVSFLTEPASLYSKRDAFLTLMNGLTKHEGKAIESALKIISEDTSPETRSASLLLKREFGFK